MNVIVSEWNSAQRNCAFEEQLLTESRHDSLLLYINAPSVIVGRNQTIEAEVDTEFCRRHGIDIVRRMSGGGTVYHDLGNVNYAFVSDRGEGGVLDADFATPIVDALRSFGVTATVGARKEIRVNGLKISGTASHVIRTRQLFHGTLLYDTDLTMLERVLQGDRECRGKGVASVPSKVVNLRQIIANGQSTEEFMCSLAGFFEEYYK